MMKKISFIFTVCFVLMLSACSFGDTTEKKLSTILSNIYEAEATYRSVQTELVETEKKEQANFQKMMTLTKDQKDELTKQVEETEKLLDARLELVKKESASIKAASSKLTELETLIKETEDKKEKALLQDVEKALTERYTAYNSLMEQYNELANLQNELYQMLITDEVEVTAVQAKVEKVNKQNEQVQKFVDKFNDLTTKLNEVKEEVFTELQKNNE